MEKMMLLSLALILLISLSLNLIFEKLKIPSLIAFMITGILLGAYVFNLIPSELIAISPDLRQIALIVILLRAGLSLDLKDLKKVGRPAILLSFLPATAEIVFIGLISPLIFDMTIIEGFMLGSIVAAVSPAVVVPRMISLIENKRGTKKQIPQMILAGSSIDDIFAIVMFTIFLQAYQTNNFSLVSLATFPLSIVISLALGLLTGWLFVKVFKKIHVRDTIKVLALFGISFLLVVIENALKNIFAVSGLLAVIAMGTSILRFNPVLSERLTGKFAKIWVGAEIMLFVLVGAAVDISVFQTVGWLPVLLIVSSLIVRMFNVFLSVARTGLNVKEKIFTCIAYTPKATVQAAIGAIPLTLGIASGNLILTISVLAIFITAPLGAIGMDGFKNKLLSLSDKESIAI